MGMSVSCPFNTDDLDSRLESFLARSTSFGDDGEKPTYRSASFNGRESEPMISKSYSCGRMIMKRSSSFKGMEQNRSYADGDIVRSPSRAWRELAAKFIPDANLSQKDDRRNMAALRLQKTYKSFRTRRRLADCAVLVEQRWWKALDFAELDRTSVSFFDIEKQETAISRWSRARTRAAKVGKGLSKDEKARKLALQHWLEAIDPRHRYGHNLQFYYVYWLQCESKQPFFYWLDIGEGKEVNHEKCIRSKLQHQCIKYLGPMERKEFEVIIEDGRLKYKQNGNYLDTREGPKDTKWIFVLSVSKELYVGQKKKGTFQHSSFLAGGATLSAGRLVVEDGILQAVWPHSGHYLPTEENFQEFVTFLQQHDVDLSHVQKSPADEDEATNHGDKPQKDKFRQKISSIEIPTKDNMLEVFSNGQERKQQQQRGASCGTEYVQSPVNEDEAAAESSDNECEETADDGYGTADDGYGTADESETEYSVSKQNLFDEDEDKEYGEPVFLAKIMQRIKSHKGMRSYQLARQLSCKWTTGAGPRIGCVRDYPSELQFRALEEVLLSPRTFSHSAPLLYDRYSPQIGPTLSAFRLKTIGKSGLGSDAKTDGLLEND